MYYLPANYGEKKKKLSVFLKKLNQDSEDGSMPAFAYQHAK